MKIQAIKTEKVLPQSTTLVALLDRSLKKMPERSLLVITSKIVALCEGRTIPKQKISEDILQQEAEYYLPAAVSRYQVPLTIVDHTFIARAGIDASNTSGAYSLLPKNSYATAKKIRTYLMKRFGRKELGVIIVDSHSLPLRRGVMGVAIGWSGFVGLKAYSNTPDIFGHHFTTHANQVDALATAASLVMGEGDEQTPLALITEMNNLTFKQTSPTQTELAFFKPPLKDDLYAPLFDFKKLKKGKRDSSLFP